MATFTSSRRLRTPECDRLVGKLRVARAHWFKDLLVSPLPRWTTMPGSFDSLFQEALSAEPESLRPRGNPHAFRDSVRISELKAPDGLKRPKRPPWCLRMLGLTRPASHEVLRRAFRRRARDVHPDKRTGSHESFLLLQRAFKEALALCRTVPSRPSR